MPSTARARARWLLRPAGRYLGASAAAALIALPVVVEQAVERVSFEDSVGTLPVEMSLCREGRSTLETGVLGDIHWAETGAAGFGVRARVTGPPAAGGTLASYVDRDFIRANVELLEDPDGAVAAYAAEFRSRLVDRVVWGTAGAGALGGLVIVLVARNASLLGGSRRRQVVVGVLLTGAVTLSAAGALALFDRWECNGEPDPAYALPDLPTLTFSSPQTREIALQVRPFIEKNRSRLESRARVYEATAEATFGQQLRRRGDALRPRAGEVLVSAEADPQGAYVGTRVREALHAALRDRLGSDAPVLRTISGDITSNGTIAEDDFVAREAKTAPWLSTAAVAGDHDSEATWAQMREHGMVVPDLSTEEVAGLRISGANDVEHKALFGQLVGNDSGISEQELGARLRDEVDPGRPGIVLLHQPDAVAGYLGLDSLRRVRELDGSLTRPVDDGVPDVPPGTVSIGHLHDLEGPWVLWNTDGDEVTWTVVDQLGTSGGVEEHSTFNRFSTPVSVPLKPVAWRLQYFHAETGLQTGFVTILCDLEGRCTISERTDVGLPLPGTATGDR